MKPWLAILPNLFAKMTIERQTADLFKPLALAAKLSLLPFSGGRVFAA